MTARLATAVAGSLALAARVPSWGAPAIVVAVGAAGLAVPASGRQAQQSTRARSCKVTVVASLALGVAAFGIVAMVAPAHVPVARAGVAVSVVAAVAEEAFFRRLVYGLLLRWGALAAVLGSAVLFAAVHVRAYGPGVLPIDAAAGVLLGWQRWATGRWEVPAATHAVANVLAVL